MPDISLGEFYKKVVCKGVRLQNNFTVGCGETHGHWRKGLIKMKKNVTMRAAGFLLVGVMLTASIVSGTYAKYVTQDSAQDTARVAKFGVVAAVSGDLFGKSYSAASGNSIQAWSVNGPTVSASGATEAAADKVVAPGTKNGTGMTISVTGTPEVSTSLALVDAVDASGNTYVNTDIELKTGDYGVMVAYNGTVTTDNVTSYYKLDNGTYTAATTSDVGATLYQFKDAANASASYKPVKWKVDTTDCADVAAVKTAIAFSTSTAVPNTNLATAYGSKTITWEWPFESGSDDAAKAATDKKDTILGDMIADSGDANYTVVKANGTGYDTVNYADVNAAANSANTVKVAYTGATAPTVMTDASVCAVLTVSFGAKLTVTQVD